MSNNSTIAAHAFSPALTTLVRAATPVLRISGLKIETWRRRPGKDPRDFRIGPWHAADWSIVDEHTYRRDGEVLYFLSDSAGVIRYVGESKGRLRTRWRTPPTDQQSSGTRNSHIFHNIAWPRIEQILAHDPLAAPFTVSAIGVETLSALVRNCPELATAIEAESLRSGGRKHLSWLVETWLCKQPSLHSHLWNVAKRRCVID